MYNTRGNPTSLLKRHTNKNPPGRDIQRTGRVSCVHHSVINISNELGYNATVIYAITKKLVPSIKLLLLAAMFMHYWTDLPNSQYQNKHIFHLITTQGKIFIYLLSGIILGLAIG